MIMACSSSVVLYLSYNITKALTLVLMSGCIITAKEYAQLLRQSEYVVLALYTFITLQCSANRQCVCIYHVTMVIDDLIIGYESSLTVLGLRLCVVVSESDYRL